MEDVRAELAPLGLLRTRSPDGNGWALAHDILGRFLISALFYDRPILESMGLGHAQTQEHLRFLILRRVSSNSILGEVTFRDLGAGFAVSIFKIDPDHGHQTFASFWREVLDALDEMPRSLQDASRVYRHHTAISRRRIAKASNLIFDVTLDDKLDLLARAVTDLTYALRSIEYTPGSEPNLNLYTSLAHAYHDLADAQTLAGAELSAVERLRDMANDCTKRAYDENPTDSFVIETYVRNLLAMAKMLPERGIERCVEALVILFSALASNEESYRRAKLGDLADEALEIFSSYSPTLRHIDEPSSALEVLAKAWLELAHGVDWISGTAVGDLPEENRRKAIVILQNPIARGNMLVIRFSYDLSCANDPFCFTRQLDYLEQLQSTDYRMTAQMRLGVRRIAVSDGQVCGGR